MKGISVMKKSLFKALCLVLIIAMLAPNAFAATPAPEAPLADAATVARVKQEIANGEITDMEDLFLVAYQHLGADISEDGMTAYINEDGTLGITQIIENNDGDASVYSRNSGSEEKTVAVTSMALVDNEGNLVTNSTYDYYSFTDTVSGSFANILVYVTHTAYYSLYDVAIGDAPEKPLYYDTYIKVSKVVTTIAYDSNAFVPTKLVQLYSEVTAPYSNASTETKTTDSPGRGTFTFVPSIADYHLEFNGTDTSCHYRTASMVYIENLSNAIYLEATNNLNTSTDNYDDHQ